ncbi:hypothetical protein TEA_018048 [Camellia sinensis var. sinensis]|uniref:Uncharacterized protein n=1 Tax=Camellia sinensis var. sinensis TaxID=542762 RepID=A0A4S4EXW0_CAMSN|nr:hypothetical protein TEA_018048 [Camellia sinensis var. sinensis]
MEGSCRHYPSGTMHQVKAYKEIKEYLINNFITCIDQNDDVKLHDDQSGFWNTLPISDDIAVKHALSNSRILEATSYGLGKLTATLTYSTGVDGTKEVFDSPHLKVLVGKRIRRRLDAKSIVQLLKSFDAPVGTTAYVEQSIPFPQDGKQTLHGIDVMYVMSGWWGGGFGYGLWIGILVASGFSVVPVPSSVWKNELKLSGNRSSKDDSREAASTLFPSMSSLLKRKKDHARLRTYSFCFTSGRQPHLGRPPDLYTYPDCNFFFTLAVGVEVRSLSLDSLREVTGCLLEMNQEVVKVILDCKQDIWNNQELFDLVKQYFENSLLTLYFCTALEKCLKRARERQELKNFKAAGDPFTEEFFSLFQSVYKNQISMLQQLQLKKKKLDKKLKSLKLWRKVSSVIFAVAFAAVLICSVVATAVAAPPVVTALAAAAAVPLGTMGKWFDSLWNKYENEVKGEREIISSMQIGTYIAIKDFDSIRVLVGRLEIEMESLRHSIDLTSSPFRGLSSCLLGQSLTVLPPCFPRRRARSLTLLLHYSIWAPSKSEHNGGLPLQLLIFRLKHTYLCSRILITCVGAEPVGALTVAFICPTLKPVRQVCDAPSWSPHMTSSICLAFNISLHRHFLLHRPHRKVTEQNRSVWLRFTGHRHPLSLLLTR